MARKRQGEVGSTGHWPGANPGQSALNSHQALQNRAVKTPGPFALGCTVPTQEGSQGPCYVSLQSEVQEPGLHLLLSKATLLVRPISKQSLRDPLSPGHWLCHSSSSLGAQREGVKGLVVIPSPTTLTHTLGISLASLAMVPLSSLKRLGQTEFVSKGGTGQCPARVDGQSL